MTIIQVGARASKLSLIQVQEVLSELRQYDPGIDFQLTTLKTTGDQQLGVSLRDLEKTDFFTRELDHMLLSGQCRLTIHSAKDLPEPLPVGIAIVAITQGIAEWDSLVLRPGETLKPGAVIATSSERREKAVLALRSDVRFDDLRGPVEKRLERLKNGTADGVVVAEAALVRLGLTHLNRIRLPGEATPFQGKLAVLARTDDEEMKLLFLKIDSRCAVSTPV